MWQNPHRAPKKNNNQRFAAFYTCVSAPAHEHVFFLHSSWVWEPLRAAAPARRAQRAPSAPREARLKGSLALPPRPPQPPPPKEE